MTTLKQGVIVIEEMGGRKACMGTLYFLFNFSVTLNCSKQNKTKCLFLRLIKKEEEKKVY